MEVAMPLLHVATRNKNKLAELQLAVDDAIRLVPLPVGAPEVEEGSESLLANARLKAEANSKFLGAPALADDTGYFVEALDGRPGVLSARFAGPDHDDAANRA